MPTLDEIFSSIRGYGQGLSAGTVQYPQAYLLANDANEIPANVTMPQAQTTRRGSMPRNGYFVGGDQQQSAPPTLTPQMSFQEALAGLRADNKAIAERNPKAWYGGNLAGAGTLAYLTGGTSTVPGMVGTNAAIGGVQGFTENEDLGDAIIGAGTGAVISRGAHELGSAVKAGADKFARSQLANKLTKLLETKPAGWKDKLYTIFGTTKDSLDSEGTSIVEQTKYLLNVLKGKEITMADMDGLVRPVATQLNTKPMMNHVGNMVNAAYQGGKGALGGYLTNEGLGWAGNLLFDKPNTPIEPWQAMATGTVLGAKNAVGKATKSIATDVATKISTGEVAASPTARRLGTLVTMPASKGAALASEKIREEDGERIMDWVIPEAPATAASAPPNDGEALMQWK